jgi:hypothetical protein
MAGVRFTALQSRPMAFLDFTSVTLDEFQQLVPPFATAFQCHMAAWRMDGKPRTARRFTRYKTCPLPTPVVLENNNRHLTPLSAEELPLFCLSFQQEVLVSFPWIGPGELGSADEPSVRPSAS